VNKFIDQLAREPVDQKVSLAFFEDDVVIARDFQSLSTFQPLQPGDYCPSGGTALYDAIGNSIEDLERNARENRVVLAIVTDGQEENSSEYTLDEVRRMIQDKRKTGRWTILFLTLGNKTLPQQLIVDLGLDPKEVISGDKFSLPAAMKQLSSAVRGYLRA